MQNGSKVTQQEYHEIVQFQLSELWTKFPLFEIWFDGGYQERVGKQILLP